MLSLDRYQSSRHKGWAWNVSLPPPVQAASPLGSIRSILHTPSTVAFSECISLIQRILGSTPCPLMSSSKRPPEVSSGSPVQWRPTWDQGRCSLGLHGVYRVMGFKPSPVSLGSSFMRSLSAGFPVLTVVSFQTLPFVRRLNSSMGPGRTVVIKGEVNTNAKGSVSLVSINNSVHAFHMYCLMPHNSLVKFK